MIDYREVLSNVNYQIRQNLLSDNGDIPIVPQSTTQKKPKYPHGTYTITSPYLNAKVFQSSESQVEDVEIVISYTFLSEDMFEVMELAQRTASMLTSTDARQKLQDKGIAIVRIDGFGSRDNFISIEVERAVGFDVRVRVRHSVLKPNDTIQTVI